MRLVHGTQIKAELRSVAPQVISVAYIGQDWASFVDVEQLGEIIVSPTAGSSPDAIADLVRRLGWDNVHFLNELHAKIFIGKTSAAVGSFNLSSNGLSGNALFEAGYIIDSPDALEELRALYDSVKIRAKGQYRTTKAKEKQLAKLREINEKLRSAGSAIPRATTSRSLTEYEPVTDTDFYCAYHEAESIEYNTAAIRKQVPEKFKVPNTDPSELVAWHLSFLETDDVHAGNWMLAWQAGDGVEIPEALDVNWMYVNAVIPNGAIDEVNAYTRVVVQWADAKGYGKPPFKLNKPEKAALRRVLASGDFPEFLPHPNREPWLLKRTFPRFKEFVAAWKEALRL